jgi:hypothetical protein
MVNRWFILFTDGLVIATVPCTPCTVISPMASTVAGIQIQHTTTCTYTCMHTQVRSPTHPPDIEVGTVGVLGVRKRGVLPCCRDRGNDHSTCGGLCFTLSGCCILYMGEQGKHDPGPTTLHLNIFSPFFLTSIWYTK